MNPVTVETMVEVGDLPLVTNDQVLKFALPMHARCGGTGRLHRQRPAEEQALCDCAQKRFMRKHAAEVSFAPDGAMVWKSKLVEPRHGR